MSRRSEPKSSFKATFKITVKGKVIELTSEEAKELYDFLFSFFGGPPIPMPIWTDPGPDQERIWTTKTTKIGD